MKNILVYCGKEWQNHEQTRSSAQPLGGNANGDMPPVEEKVSLLEQALSVKVSGDGTVKATCGIQSHFSIFPPDNANDEWDDAIDVELILDGEEGNRNGNSNNNNNISSMKGPVREDGEKSSCRCVTCV